MEKIKLTVINAFHNTAASFFVEPSKTDGIYSVRKETLRRLDKKLCPHGRNKACGCAGMDRPAKTSPDFVIGETHEGRAWVTINKS